MSVTSHLKDLLTKMGGTPKDGDSTSVLIDKIEDVYNGSGSGGGGSSGGSGDNLIVTIYADDMVDNPKDTYAVNVTLKMNRTYNEILNAYETGKNIDFIFETKRMPPMVESLTPSDLYNQLILVLHNNHSIKDLEELLPEVNLGGSNANLMFITEEFYNAHQPSENEYVLMGQWRYMRPALMANAPSAYSIYLSTVNNIIFDEPFTCQNGNDYPSCIVEGSIK